MYRCHLKVYLKSHLEKCSACRQRFREADLSAEHRFICPDITDEQVTFSFTAPDIQQGAPELNISLINDNALTHSLELAIITDGDQSIFG